MNVSLTNPDAAHGIMKIEILKADYADAVEKNLRSVRQKANMPGFRKGMVPMGMVKKMYGKQVLAEEVNKLVTDSMFKYISDNNLNILGEPLPNEAEQKVIDFDTDEDFEFVFDLALAPEINFSITKRDKLPFYEVTIGDDMVEEQIGAYQNNFADYKQVEEVEEKDLVKGLVTELENGEPKADGITFEDGLLMPMYMKDEEEQAKFMGAAVNSTVVFNPYKAYDGAESELASFLKIPKEQVADMKSDFSFEIKEITRAVPGELNQEFFDRIYGEGNVKSEEEFTERIRQSLIEQFAPQSDYKFLEDARDLLVKKAGKLDFAEDLLKRWLLIANEGNTPEKVDEDYPTIIRDLTYHLAKEYLIKKNELKVEEADIDGLAKQVAKAQFAQYGMLSVPEDVLDNYAKDMLKNKETLKNVIDRALENKLIAWLKEHVKLDVKPTTIDEFNDLMK
ncbi:trigger factor [Parabacteroides sp. OttesenSCG-928-G07]|nr:trigger factor [Parabacteroides sp. OttesenSCG-928-G21]MDL2278289.1 trigger factor [Parabacteroides sp. OttesenSCG-928-G07]